TRAIPSTSRWSTLQETTTRSPSQVWDSTYTARLNPRQAGPSLSPRPGPSRSCARSRSTARRCRVSWWSCLAVTPEKAEESRATVTPRANRPDATGRAGCAGRSGAAFPSSGPQRPIQADTGGPGQAPDVVDPERTETSRQDEEHLGGHQGIVQGIVGFLDWDAGPGNALGERVGTFGSVLPFQPVGQDGKAQHIDRPGHPFPNAPPERPGEEARFDFRRPCEEIPAFQARSREMDAVAQRRGLHEIDGPNVMDGDGPMGEWNVRGDLLVDRCGQVNAA